MSRWAGFTLATAIGWALLSVAARADLPDAVNWARLQGCRGSAARNPLRMNPKLSNAALRMAGGQSLHASLISVAYLSAQSSAVHLSGAVDDSEVGRILAASYCVTLTDPLLTEMGSQRRGHDVWMVLAAPVSLPVNSAAGRQVLDLVNSARASGHRCGSKEFSAARPLTLNPSLNAAALAHSQEMAEYAAFEHRGHDGSSPAMRVARAGFGSALIVGENIAAGAMTPIEVTQGWLASPAHCENIMDPRFSQIGIAVAVSLTSSELAYWTQDFAAPRAAAQP